MGGMSLFHFAGEQFLVDKWATMTDRLSCFHFFILWLGGFCTLKLQSYSNRFSSKSELSWFVEQHVAVASQQNLWGAAVKIISWCWFCCRWSLLLSLFGCPGCWLLLRECITICLWKLPQLQYCTTAGSLSLWAAAAVARTARPERPQEEQLAACLYKQQRLSWNSCCRSDNSSSSWQLVSKSSQSRHCMQEQFLQEWQLQEQLTACCLYEQPQRSTFMPGSLPITTLLSWNEHQLIINWLTCIEKRIVKNVRHINFKVGLGLWFDSFDTPY